jgi:hypothetical protein
MYAALLSGFVRTGILKRQRLRRIGSGLGARYVMLPGLAQLDETVIDKFEAAGLKLLRNRVTTLRLWLQLWGTQSGHIVSESAGEVTVARRRVTASTPERPAATERRGRRQYAARQFE